MRRFLFYFRHAANNLRHSGHWTTFAVFCVAAGVATVVALRSLGLAIDDSLISNLRQLNHGDINVTSLVGYGPFAFTFQRGDYETQIISKENVEWTRNWAAGHNAKISPYSLISNIQFTPYSEDKPSAPQFATSFLIDPQTFDMASPIVALDPAGIALKDLFTDGHDVVMSRNLADSQNLKVGDQVRVSNSDEPFVLRGIVATETESSINNVLASFFGFAYFDIAQANTLQLNPNPNTISIVMPDDATADDISKAADELTPLARFRDVNATPWLLKRNKELADLIGRFIVTMGLGAMLIGGVGIMNTMLVLVGRRTMEIAALKTFGLKGRQIAALFMAEAFLLGVIGSLLGVLAGLGLSGAVNAFGETFLQQKLPWRLHPDAMVYGVALGMVVTLVFGVLPVLMAANVRPAIVLRPNETHLPRASLFQVFIALSVVVIVLGVIAGQIIGPVIDSVFTRTTPPNPIIIGIVLVSVVMLVLALLTGVMWGVVWLIGRLPTFGQVDMRLALRNLSSRRVRTATTLLALAAGMFALSAITYFGLGAREVIRFQFAQTLGGNVMLIPLVPRQIAQPLVRTLLSTQDSVQYDTLLNINLGRITVVDNVPIKIQGKVKNFPLSILTRDTDNPTLTSGPLIAGRDLTAADRGKDVIILTQQNAIGGLVQGFDSLDDLGVKVGSIIQLQFSGRSHRFEVVGIVGTASRFTPSIANAYIPPDVSGLTNSGYQLNVVQVEPDKLNTFLTNMSKMPLVFAFDVSFIDGLLKRLIDQLAAIPTIVGLLSLTAAAVIMANTVSLTMLERRQQIGILKVLGLNRRRVLWVVLLENTVIGLLGGLIGIGISSLGVTILTVVGTGFSVPLPSDATWITVGLVVASVVIAWVATLLSARVAIRERVARILRYE